MDENLHLLLKPAMRKEYRNGNIMAGCIGLDKKRNNESGGTYGLDYNVL
jgi:hypothetical protein